MSDHTQLLHNMSTPPKSVVKYTGLGGAPSRSRPGLAEAASRNSSSGGPFGKAVRFNLPAAFRGASTEKVLAALEAHAQVDAQTPPDRRLIALINRRAAELPLPDGCAVIKVEPKQEVLWGDLLSALAVLSKSTDTVWLRSKSPSLSWALQRSSISLLVPPAFVARLLEARP